MSRVQGAEEPRGRVKGKRFKGRSRKSEEKNNLQCASVAKYTQQDLTENAHRNQLKPLPSARLLTMTPLTTSEKETIISRLFWDVPIQPIDADKLLAEKLKAIDDFQSQQFFVRLLTSCDWYTLLKLIPADKLGPVLSDRIVNNLFPKDLRHKYIYARKILSRNAIPVSGKNP